MGIKSNSQEKQTWTAKNKSRKIINIGDLPKVPSFDPGGTHDLLRYYDKETINRSNNLSSLMKAGFIKLIKKTNGSREETFDPTSVNSVEGDEITVIQTLTSSLSNNVSTLMSAPTALGIQSKQITNRPISVTYTSPCDNTSEWRGTGYSTVAYDTDNYICFDDATVKRSIKNTKDTTHGVNIMGFDLDPVFNPVKDITNNHILIRYYLHEGTGSSDYRGIDYIVLQLADADGDRLQFKIYKTSSATWAYTEGPGWHTWVGIPEIAYSESGTFNPTTLTDITLTATAKATYGGIADTDMDFSITYDEVTFFPPPSKATVMWRLDDGIVYNLGSKHSQFDMASYLSTKGMRGTIGINGETVGTTEGSGGTLKTYLTLDQLKILQGQGHLISNHGWWRHNDGDHKNFLDLSESGIQDSFDRNADWMIVNGFTEGARILIVPQDVYPSKADTALRGRTDFVWLVKDKGGEYGGGSEYYPYFMNGFLADGVTSANLDISYGLVEGCKGVWCPYWHSEPSTIANYYDHVDTIAADYAAGNINVITPMDMMYK